MRLFRIPFIFTFIFIIILLVYLPAAWAGGNIGPNVTPPGAEKSTKTRILETGVAVHG